MEAISLSPLREFESILDEEIDDLRITYIVPESFNLYLSDIASHIAMQADKYNMSFPKLEKMVDIFALQDRVLVINNKETFEKQVSLIMFRIVKNIVLLYPDLDLTIYTGMYETISDKLECRASTEVYELENHIDVDRLIESILNSETNLDVVEKAQERFKNPQFKAKIAKLAKCII